jgi:hypothetical protein
MVDHSAVLAHLLGVDSKEVAEHIVSSCHEFPGLVLSLSCLTSNKEPWAQTRCAFGPMPFIVSCRQDHSRRIEK